MVGNWIMKDGEPFQVTAYTFMIIERHNTENASLSSFEPIILTSDILGKCGFTRGERQDYSGDKFYVWYKDGIDIHEDWNGENFMYATYVKGEFRSFKAGVYVETLHHLQNIVHAFSGQELTYTP